MPTSIGFSRWMLYMADDVLALVLGLGLWALAVLAPLVVRLLHG